MRSLAVIACFLALLSTSAHAQGRKAVVVSGANPGQARPAVIFLHGKGGNGAQLQRQADIDRTFLPLGVVTLYPSGQNGTWNAGLFRNNTNDVDYLDRMLDYYVSQKIVDPRRVYLVGMSNGGLMVQKMICSSRYTFAGVAVVMATHPNPESCQTPKPAPLMIFWGTEDDFFPRDGVEPNDWAKRMRFSSRKDTIHFWRTAHQCPRDVLPLPSADGKVEMRSYPGCAVPLTIYDLIGVGHAWPGAKRSRRMGDDPAREPGTVKIDPFLIQAWGLK